MEIFQFEHNLGFELEYILYIVIVIVIVIIGIICIIYISCLIKGRHFSAVLNITKKNLF